MERLTLTQFKFYAQRVIVDKSPKVKQRNTPEQITEIMELIRRGFNSRIIDFDLDTKNQIINTTIIELERRYKEANAAGIKSLFKS